MTDARYLTLLGFVLLIYAQQLRQGDRFDKWCGFVLNVIVVGMFTYELLVVA